MSIDPEFDPFRTSMPPRLRLYSDSMTLVANQSTSEVDKYVAKNGEDLRSFVLETTDITLELRYVRKAVSASLAGADTIILTHVSMPNATRGLQDDNAALFVGLELFNDGSPYMSNADLDWAARTDNNYLGSDHTMMIFPEREPLLVANTVFDLHNPECVSMLGALWKAEGNGYKGHQISDAESETIVSVLANSELHPLK